MAGQTVEVISVTIRIDGQPRTIQMKWFEDDV